VGRQVAVQHEVKHFGGKNIDRQYKIRGTILKGVQKHPAYGHRSVKVTGQGRGERGGRERE